MGQEDVVSKEQAVGIPVQPSVPIKHFDWTSYVAPIIIIAIVGSWVWWINQPEQYDLVSASDQHSDVRGDYYGISDPIDFRCHVDDGVTVITVPLIKISTKIRDDGKMFTSVLFSDTDCDNGDINCIGLTCRERLDGGRHRGKSAEILVPTDADLKIWNDYLEKEKAANLVNPARVLPPGSQDVKQAEYQTSR
ncbi:MAG: hypothetical protein G01um101419_868 [Parcubacteria group bacterium Gr01-1014_19]|nr:MAG: hypothetical protein G01um101419_868 [Parcubacteria group bacterium Gr01-1014_19]